MSTTEEITRVLNAFGLHADTHRWDKLLALFAPEVTVDYTSLHGGSVQATKAADLVGAWKIEAVKLIATCQSGNYGIMKIAQERAAAVR